MTADRAQLYDTRDRLCDMLRDIEKNMQQEGVGNYTLMQLGKDVRKEVACLDLHLEGRAEPMNWIDYSVQVKANN